MGATDGRVGEKGVKHRDAHGRVWLSIVQILVLVLREGEGGGGGWRTGSFALRGRG
jgi:hypothetical protein